MTNGVTSWRPPAGRGTLVFPKTPESRPRAWLCDPSATLGPATEDGTPCPSQPCKLEKTHALSALRVTVCDRRHVTVLTVCETLFNTNALSPGFQSRLWGFTGASVCQPVVQVSLLCCVQTVFHVPRDSVHSHRSYVKISLTGGHQY